MSEPDMQFENIKCLLLDMAQERSLQELLDLIAKRLADRPNAALARIWLKRPGDLCSDCNMRANCPNQTECMHLVASAGNPITEDSTWSHLDGRFKRFPMGVRKIGHIAQSGEAVEIADTQEETAWIADPEWAQREGIRGFGGQPLVFKDEVLGVLALFTRVPFVREGSIWLRVIADHAATAIANANAFEEIERLQRQLELENTYLKQEFTEAQSFGSIVGRSPALNRVLEQIELVAPTEANVLVLGESGSGKELVAREIHERSPRKDRPMIKVNCAAIPKDLYESEFFGHAQGAFTGAVKDRVGRFELADGGTLFLDEVGEIPLDLQSRLLRVLQEGQFERVGEDRTRSVDVRIVAATNRDLEKDVAEGTFRQDLYYRLNVFPLNVVPLRERKEDISLLAPHFLARAALRSNLSVPQLTEADLLRLQEYDWPGNVRELQNVLERALIISQGGGLRFELPNSVGSNSTQRSAKHDKTAIVSEDEMRRRERENIANALIQSDWRIYGSNGAAKLLGIRPTTLASRIKKMKIKKPAG